MANSRPSEVTKPIIDIYEYSSELDPVSVKDGESIAIGDLHANALKLLKILHYKGAIDISKENYEQLVNIYKRRLELVEKLNERYFAETEIKNANFNIALAKKENKAPASAHLKKLETAPKIIDAINAELPALEKQAAEDIANFKAILEKITAKSTPIIELIGDELADRGAGDDFVLEILDHLKKNLGMKVNTLASNHGMGFFNSLEKDAHSFLSPDLMVDDQNSMRVVKHLIDKNIISEKRINELANRHKETLKIIDYKIDKDKNEISIYSHAPIDIAIVEQVARALDVPYHDATIIELANTIENINTVFQQYVKNNALNTLFRSEDDTFNKISDKQKSGEILTAQEEAILAAAPFIFTIWNRADRMYASFPIIARKPTHNGYNIKFVHGHDPVSSQPEQQGPHIIDLDDRLGKYKNKEHNQKGAINVEVSSSRSLTPEERPASLALTEKQAFDIASKREERINKKEKEQTSQKAVKHLLKNLAISIAHLPNFYKNVIGGKRSHESTIKSLTDELNKTYGSSLSDIEKYKQLVQIVYKTFISLGGSKSNYSTYLNTNPQKDRLARALGLIIADFMKNEAEIYPSEYGSLPTMSITGSRANDINKITAPQDPAYKEIQTALPTNFVEEFKEIHSPNHKPLTFASAKEKASGAAVAPPPEDNSRPLDFDIESEREPELDVGDDDTHTPPSQAKVSDANSSAASAAMQPQPEQPKPEPVKLNPGEVNLYEYSTERDPISVKDGENIAIGDLHANVMKLLKILHHKGVINIAENDYKELVAIYKRRLELVEKLNTNEPIADSMLNQAAEDAASFAKILDRISANSKPTLYLIGDELADRGAGDDFVLAAVNHLKNLGITVRTMISNHTVEFYKGLEKGVFETHKLQEKDNNSMRAMKYLIDKNVLNEGRIKKLAADHRKTLKLVDYKLSEDRKEITIYSHAPIDLNIIKSIAEEFGIPYKDDTTIALANTIEAINTVFQEYAEQNKLHTLFTNGDAPLNEAFDKLQNNYPLTEEETVLLKAAPFILAIWNRGFFNRINNEMTALPKVKAEAEHKGYKCNFTHGHDNERNPKNTHVKNTDDNLGKYRGANSHGEKSNINNNIEVNSFQSLSPNEKVALTKDQVTQSLEFREKSIAKAKEENFNINSDLAAAQLLRSIVNRINNLDKFYRTAQGGIKRSHSDQLKKLIADVNSINANETLSDMTKYETILQRMKKDYEDLSRAAAKGKHESFTYTTYLNTNPTEERFGRVLGVIFRDCMTDEKAIYGENRNDLPTQSRLGHAAQNINDIKTPGDNAYKEITRAKVPQAFTEVIKSDREFGESKHRLSIRSPNSVAKDNLGRKKVDALKGNINLIAQLIGHTPFSNDNIPENIRNKAAKADFQNTAAQMFWDAQATTKVTGIALMEDLFDDYSKQIPAGSETQNNILALAEHLRVIIRDRKANNSSRTDEVLDLYNAIYNMIVDIKQAADENTLETAIREFHTKAREIHTHIEKHYANYMREYDADMAATFGFEAQQPAAPALEDAPDAPGFEDDIILREEPAAAPPSFDEEEDFELNPSAIRILATDFDNKDAELAQQIEFESDATKAEDLKKQRETLKKENTEKKSADTINTKEKYTVDSVRLIKELVGYNPLPSDNEDYANTAAKMFWDQRSITGITGLSKMEKIFDHKLLLEKDMGEELRKIAEARLKKGNGFFSKRDPSVSYLYRKIDEVFTALKDAQTPEAAKKAFDTFKKNMDALFEHIKINYDEYKNSNERKELDDFLGIDRNKPKQ